MKKTEILSLTALALLSGPARPSHAANVPYFPYETIENYYKTQPEQPAVSEPPAVQLTPPAAQEPRGARQPVAVTAAPDFLFPAKLGFGVAVGVPYDMMYLSKTYYCWQNGVWYRANWYRGPWTEIGASQLPPELHKQTLAKIRELRNKEFKEYWKDQEHYHGKRFRPGELKEK